MATVVLEVHPATCQYCGALSPAGPYCCLACENLSTRVGPLPILKALQNPFSFYDSKEFRDLYFQKNSTYDYIFYAEGLHCSSCVHLLEKLPQFYPEVISARVHFSSSTVAVQLTNSASLAQVAYVIQELGYKPTLLSAQDNLQEKYILENRNYLKRIAVAGFCAGNTMLFVIPVYAGLAGTWAQVFNWLSFLLFLPVLFYSAVPFYRGAWNSLKYQVLTVDLPIVMAMLSGFSLSTYSLLQGHGEIYYDSTASFLFFILSARYFLKRVQQNYLSPSNLNANFKNEQYEVITPYQTQVYPWSSLKAGDLLRLSQRQTVPSDAELLSAHATLDLSLFNGESMPKVFSKGMQLFAGSKVLDTSINIKLLVDFSESKLGHLLTQLDDGALTKSPFVQLTDKLAQKLILSVFTIALLFFFAYSFVDAQAAFNRSLSLIVLACPCALAFGSPLTFALALKKAQKMGILIKDSSVLERMIRIKNVFFDKTGTITDGTLKLSFSQPPNIPEKLQKIILSLEAPSYHPLAFAIRQAWIQPENLYQVQEAREILGQGVQGTIEGAFYEIRTLGESSHACDVAVEVFKDQKSICQLYFTDELRKDSFMILKSLKKKGLQCFLLSGDKKSKVKEVATTCQIPSQNAFGELYPEDKLDIISQYNQTCMIGDGANDSLCLKKADVGIAVKGSVDLSLQSADVYLTKGGLIPVLELFQLSAQTREVLIRNLAISLVYNSVGGTLALAGFINPMLAAILMPLSSLAIILSTLWGFR